MVVFIENEPNLSKKSDKVGPNSSSIIRLN